jgi:hypothetical protein
MPQSAATGPRRRGLTADVTFRYSVIGGLAVVTLAAFCLCIWSVVNGYRNSNSTAIWVGVLGSPVCAMGCGFWIWGLWKVWQYSREIVHDGE